MEAKSAKRWRTVNCKGEDVLIRWLWLYDNDFLAKKMWARKDMERLIPQFWRQCPARFQCFVHDFSSGAWFWDSHHLPVSTWNRNLQVMLASALYTDIISNLNWYLPDVQIFGTHAVANIIYSGLGSSNPAMKLGQTPQNSSKFVTFFIHKTSSDRLFLPRSGPNASANGMCNRFCLATLPVRWVRILDGRWWGWRLWKEDWRKLKGNNSTGSKLADFRIEVAGQNGT